jgi:hypothetical protein
VLVLHLNMIYLLTATGLSPGGSTHLHTNNTQNNTNNNRTPQITSNVEECGPCPVFASFTLAFALQLRKKHGETSVRIRKTPVGLRKTSVRVQYTYYRNTHTNTHITHKHTQIPTCSRNATAEHRRPVLYTILTHFVGHSYDLEPQK